MTVKMPSENSHALEAMHGSHMGTLERTPVRDWAVMKLKSGRYFVVFFLTTDAIEGLEEVSAREGMPRAERVVNTVSARSFIAS